MTDREQFDLWCGYNGQTPTASKLHVWQSATATALAAHDMNLVAEKYAHNLALDLECVLADYSGTWYETAMKTLGEYRSAMNAIHERESPTFMGEPLILKDTP